MPTGQKQIGLGGDSNTSGPEEERTTIIRLCSTEACSAVSCWEPIVAIRFRRQEDVDKFTVFVDSDFAGEPVSRKSTTGLVAQIAAHTVESGSTLQSANSAERGRSGVLRGGGRRSSSTFLETFYMDLGIQMKVEIQSVSSTAKSLTDRLGAEPNMKHINARFFRVQERVQDGDLSIKKVRKRKSCADV